MPRTADSARVSADARPGRGLLNPYLDLFARLPPAVRRDPALPPSAVETALPEWLVFKAAIAGHFAWAVPTEDAIAAIARHAAAVVEIGAGAGYWAWLLRQAGVEVAAFDIAPPAFTWTEVRVGGEAVARDYPGKALFLCWPPWGAGMATRALAAYAGQTVIYIGEWMGGAAEPSFFAGLNAGFACVEVGARAPRVNRGDRPRGVERRP